MNNMFNNSLNYDTNSLNNSSLDSHLMKNMEWGAVAYLTHSKYGRNGTKITFNSNTSAYTAGGSGATAHTNVLQSTTGNCYGIFDMNGGASYTLASHVKGANNSYIVNLVNADNKYKEVYDSTSSTSDYAKMNGIRSYGDALYETSSACILSAIGTASSWHSGISGYFASSWFVFSRGGYWGNGNNVGVFAFGRDTGKPATYYSFRVTLWNN